MGISNKQKLINDERDKGIIKDFNEGVLDREEIALKYGLKSINGVLKKYRIKSGKKGGRKKKLFQQVDKEWVNKQILALTKQGFDYKYIARRYSIQRKYITKIVKDSGIIRGNSIDSKPITYGRDSLTWGVGSIPYGDNCTVMPRYRS